MALLESFALVPDRAVLIGATTFCLLGAAAILAARHETNVVTDEALERIRTHHSTLSTAERQAHSVYPALLVAVANEVNSELLDSHRANVLARLRPATFSLAEVAESIARAVDQGPRQSDRNVAVECIPKRKGYAWSVWLMRHNGAFLQLAAPFSIDAPTRAMRTDDAAECGGLFADGVVSSNVELDFSDAPEALTVAAHMSLARALAESCDGRAAKEIRKLGLNCPFSDANTTDHAEKLSAPILSPEVIYITTSSGTMIDYREAPGAVGQFPAISQFASPCYNAVHMHAFSPEGLRPRLAARNFGIGCTPLLSASELSGDPDVFVSKPYLDATGAGVVVTLSTPIPSGKFAGAVLNIDYTVDPRVVRYGIIEALAPMPRAGVQSTVYPSESGSVDLVLSTLGRRGDAGARSWVERTTTTAKTPDNLVEYNATLSAFAFRFYDDILFISIPLSKPISVRILSILVTGAVVLACLSLLAVVLVVWLRAKAEIHYQGFQAGRIQVSEDGTCLFTTTGARIALLGDTQRAQRSFRLQDACVSMSESQTLTHTIQSSFLTQDCRVHTCIIRISPTKLRNAIAGSSTNVDPHHHKQLLVRVHPGTGRRRTALIMTMWGEVQAFQQESSLTTYHIFDAASEHARWIRSRLETIGGEQNFSEQDQRFQGLIREHLEPVHQVWEAYDRTISGAVAARFEPVRRSLKVKALLEEARAYLASLYKDLENVDNIGITLGLRMRLSRHKKRFLREMRQEVTGVIENIEGRRRNDIDRLRLYVDHRVATFAIREVLLNAVRRAGEVDNCRLFQIKLKGPIALPPHIDYRGGGQYLELSISNTVKRDDYRRRQHSLRQLRGKPSDVNGGPGMHGVKSLALARKLDSHVVAHVHCTDGDRGSTVVTAKVYLRVIVGSAPALGTGVA